MYLVWAFRGKHAGKFVPLPSQEAVDQAVADGWAQDARTTGAAELRYPEDEKDMQPSRSDKQGYLTRDMVAAKKKRHASA